MPASEDCHKNPPPGLWKSKVKEKFLEVRRDFAKTLRMDRSAPDYSLEAPQSPYGHATSDAPIRFSTSPSYHPNSPDMDRDTLTTDRQFDGTTAMFPRRSRVLTPVAAIFVHAGAGYHSTTNEQYHLAACSDACKMAMNILKAGGSAVDAVEAAIRVLEDREITNAGYGSNLSIMGRVEGDATVVDHLGRSGACGATPQIKNPINLARMILELSNRPLSLRRVPPNLLVGQGATEFGREHGMSIVSHETIISKNALERYSRWKEDLRRAELPRTVSQQTVHTQYSGEEDEGHSVRDHTNALLTGTWNEGQPDSPAPASPAPQRAGTSSFYPNIPLDNDEGLSAAYLNQQPQLHASSPQPIPASPPPRTNLRSPVSYGGTPAKRPRYADRSSDDGPPRIQSPLGQYLNTRRTPNNSDGAESPVKEDEDSRVDSLNLDGEREDEDHITDTVGAIAIDNYGNIAAGSSSGGIGMKHSGRVGPAALVGIGSAVIPVDDHDPEGVTVAAVTSGTGEHMATTMASQKCCERLYNNTRKGPGPRGIDVQCNEEDAIESFVTMDFMEHPGVQSSHSAGAIGVMAVKKMSGGFYLHFAHNTDSFALASMHSNETSAKCVMSRLGERSKVVQGGRKVRVD